MLCLSFFVLGVGAALKEQYKADTRPDNGDQKSDRLETKGDGPELAALSAPLKMVTDFKKIQQQGTGTGAKAGEYESDGLFHVQ